MTDEVRLELMRPDQILKRIEACPAVFIPVGPLEWHGPHMPFGTDPINARLVAEALCKRYGGVLWPTLWWGTERERDPDCAENLGFQRDAYVVGMDFPKNSVPSAYCREEVFGILVSETLRMARKIGAKHAIVINGHGAINHNQALRRIATEWNNETDLKVSIRIAFLNSAIKAGSIGHATSDETSLMMYYAPETVDISALPPLPQKFKFADFAIVDGPGFDGKGDPERNVIDDPRTKSSAKAGERFFIAIVEEILAELKSGTL